MSSDSEATVPDVDDLDTDGIEAEFDDASLDGIVPGSDKDATGDAPNGGK